ncbi:MAG: hypothetical protein EBS01_02805, partial [Verrucomicrobia bacterium]|nr:hypothetical protein [Verrucomicrobiota bacterium]
MPEGDVFLRQMACVGSSHSRFNGAAASKPDLGNRKFRRRQRSSRLELSVDQEALGDQPQHTMIL